MELSTLNEIGDLFRKLEEKKFPNSSISSTTSMARQIGVLSVYVSERDAKKIIKNVREELEGLN